MKGIVYLLVFTACLKGLTLNAHLSKKIDELHPLHVVFSNKSLNRITVQGSGVKKLIAPEDKFDIQIDEITGNAFISIKDLTAFPLTFSIITDNGYVQDVEVGIADKTSETLLLLEPTAEELIYSVSPKKAAIKVLPRLIEKKLPQGYCKVEFNQEDGRRVHNPQLEFLPKVALDGPFERIVIYTLKNHAKVKTPIREHLLAQQGDRWVFLSKEMLEEKEEATLIIGMNKTS